MVGLVITPVKVLEVPLLGRKPVRADIFSVEGSLVWPLACPGGCPQIM